MSGGFGRSMPPTFDKSAEEPILIDDASIDDEDDDNGLDPDLPCELCGRSDDEENMLICDECDKGYHTDCLGLRAIPKSDSWYCMVCRANHKGAKGAGGRSKKVGGKGGSEAGTSSGQGTSGSIRQKEGNGIELTSGGKPRIPEDLLGHEVMRQFYVDGEGSRIEWFYGKITEVHRNLAGHDMVWTVKYDDGEIEDLPWKQLEVIIGPGGGKGKGGASTAAA